MEQEQKSALITLMIITLIILATCSGCASPPVKQKFPEVPEIMLKKCAPLEQLADEPKLSDVARTVAKNYGSYAECSVNNDAWIEWYQTQKKIFEEANK